MIHDGIKNFTITCLETVELPTKRELQIRLNEREVYYIDLFQSTTQGYNQTKGGAGVKDLSESSRKKIAESKKGEKNPMYGKKWTEEKRQKMTEMMSGTNNPRYGVTLSDETKQKLCNQLKGREITDEWRTKISTTMKGVGKSEEMRKNLSMAKQGTTLTEETKQKIKASRLKGSDNPKSKRVCQYSMDDTLISTHESMSDAARAVHSYHSVISNCCRGIKKSAAGFKWAYEI